MQTVHAATLYGRAAARLVVRGGREIRLPPEASRAAGTCSSSGCPRSGTTFLAGVLGEQPGLIDLGEASPVKAAIPGSLELSEEDAAARLQLILARIRRLGLVAHLRGVEQTPEMCFVLGARSGRTPRLEPSTCSATAAMSSARCSSAAG